METKSCSQKSLCGKLYCKLAACLHVAQFYREAFHGCVAQVQIMGSDFSFQNSICGASPDYLCDSVPFKSSTQLRTCLTNTVKLKKTGTPFFLVKKIKNPAGKKSSVRVKDFFFQSNSNEKEVKCIESLKNDRLNLKIFSNIFPQKSNSSTLNSSHDKCPFQTLHL